MHIFCKTENCHDLAGNGNAESILTHKAIRFSAQTYDHAAQSTVIHIHAAGNQDTAGVNMQGISLMNMVVQHRTKQVVCRCDRVHISCEMQVNILHRDDLRPSASGCTAFNAKNRPKAWLTQCNHRFLSNLGHCFAETDTGCCLSFARRGWVNRCHKHQFPVWCI